MAVYILRRLLWLVPALCFISVVTFGLMHAVSGGPWDLENRPVPPAVRENLDRKYGLDKPLVEQYLMFASNAVLGDLGLSLTVQQNRPVTDMLLTGLRSTVLLAVLSLGLAVVAGVGLGVVSALHRNRPLDHVAVLAATAGSAVPSFVAGIFFIYVFATQLHWLPTRGWSLSEGLVRGWVPQPEQMVLPVITLALLPAAYLARITRASLLEVLNQDYMRTARAKGLHQRTVLWRHGMRNAGIPIVSVLGPLLGAVLTGSFIIENMFSVPGIGTLLVRGIGNRDYNLIMGLTLFYATVAVLVHLAVDIAYAYLDPRVRYR